MYYQVGAIAGAGAELESSIVSRAGARARA